MALYFTSTLVRENSKVKYDNKGRYKALYTKNHARSLIQDPSCNNQFFTHHVAIIS
jgi:hypothetical protein